jgi:hypothetical protein
MTDPGKRPLAFDLAEFEKLSQPEKLEYLRAYIDALNARATPASNGESRRRDPQKPQRPRKKAM